MTQNIKFGTFVPAIVGAVTPLFFGNTKACTGTQKVVGKTWSVRYKVYQVDKQLPSEKRFCLTASRFIGTVLAIRKLVALPMLRYAVRGVPSILLAGKLERTASGRRCNE